MKTLLAAGLILAAVGAPVLAADVPAAVTRAAELHAKDVAGVMGYQSSVTMTIAAPMMNRKSTWRTWVVARDGKPVETRILSLTTDGKAGTAAEIKKMETRMNSDTKSPWDMPYERAHLGAYVYTPADCTGCEPGETAFAFRPKTKSARLGVGTLTLAKSGRLSRLVYAPSEMPPRMSEGSLELTAGMSGAEGWGLKQMNSVFKGGMGPLKGSMTMALTYSGQRHFESVEAAKKAKP